MCVESAPSNTAESGIAVSLDATPGASASRSTNALTPERSALATLISPELLDELWATSGAEHVDLSREEFIQVIESVGAKFNFGVPADLAADAAQRAAFLRALHLEELALAQACALGRERAWEEFIRKYRAQLITAATAITNSSRLGADLADALYAELYGLREKDHQRRCPLASYSGRGSLLGWLRATLVQRYRDHYRRTRRETPLDEIDAPTPPSASPVPAELATLSAAVGTTLAQLAAEDRFLLAAYYLDRQTLLQIARTLHVHEATISRRLKRLAEQLRTQLLAELRSRGLSKAAAEEALGADPRDIEINLRALLQTSQAPTFSPERAATVPETV